MKGIGFIFCFFVSMLLFSGCASTGFLMSKPKVTLLGNTYSPKEKGSTMDVFITKKPTQEYVEFAQITCNDTNDKWSLDQILRKAREIGADAIIIIGKASSAGVGIPMGYSTYIASEEYGMTAIAIRYKQQ